MKRREFFRSLFGGLAGLVLNKMVGTEKPICYGSIERTAPSTSSSSVMSNYRFYVCNEYGTIVPYECFFGEQL